MKLPQHLWAFDLIGTLFDAKHVYVHAFSEACKIHGLSTEDHSAEINDAIGNKRLSEIVANIFPNMPPEKFLEFQVTCNTIRDQRLMTDCEPFPDALEAVGYLRSIGQDTALITGTSESGMKTLVDRFDLTKLFSAENILYRDLEKDSGLSATQLKTKQLLQLENRDWSKLVLMVGDSVSDREAAFFPHFDFWGFVPDQKDRALLEKTTLPSQLFGSYREFIDTIKGHMARIAASPEPAPESI